MLLELGICDAYTSTQNTEIKRYTDITQMSIALAELLVQDDRVIDSINISSKIIEAITRDPRYKDKSTCFEETRAIIRAIPLGYLPNITDVISHATKQAKITNTYEETTKAATIAALMAHYFIYDKGLKKDLSKFIEIYVSNLESSKITLAIKEAINAIEQEDSLLSIFERCIVLEEYPDFTSKIALAIASCCNEVKRDLPSTIVEKIENGKYGKSYLIKLDEKLKSKFGRS